MQNGKMRPGHWPWRRNSRRIGADAAFAKALARSEFGRFYTDDQEQREIARSLARTRKKRNGVGAEAAERQEAEAKAEKKPPKKVQLWRPPSIRERRSELAAARARLMAASKLSEQEKK